MLPGGVVLSKSGAAVAADFNNSTGTPLVVDTDTGNGYVLTASGTAVAMNTQLFVSAITSVSANTVLAGPTSGSASSPAFRKLVNADIALFTPQTTSLTADVTMTSTGSFFDGPTLAQGTAGTWFVSGSITMIDTSAAAQFKAKLWDGTNVIGSTQSFSLNSTNTCSIALSGVIVNPTGNIRISAQDLSSTSGKILFNQTGLSKDSTLTAIRIA